VCRTCRRLAAPTLPDNGRPWKKNPEGGLRNTIYEQQTRSGRRLTRGRLFLYKIARAGWALSLVRLVWRWSRVVRWSAPSTSRRRSSARPRSFPVYWHQHQLFCVKHLLDLRAG
jgi:hypothetical protein